MALVEALNFLSEKSPGSRDLIDVPGRMLVLHHAWYWLNHHPNMQLDHHASTAVKKVCLGFASIMARNKLSFPSTLSSAPGSSRTAASSVVAFTVGSKSLAAPTPSNLHLDRDVLDAP